MFQWLRGLDFFAPDVDFNIQGESKFKTKTGAIFTVAYIAVLLTIFGQEFSKFLDTSNPISVGESFNRAEYPEIDLRDQGLLPVIIAYSDEVTPIPPEDIPKYFTVTFTRISWQFDEVANNYRKNQQVEIAKPCKSLSQEELKYLRYLQPGDSFSIFALEFGLCPKLNEEIVVRGKSADDLFELVTYKIKPCSLGTGGCLSTQHLSKSNIQIVLPTSNFDSSKKKNPTKQMANSDDVFYFNPNLRQQYVYKIRETNVLDYSGALGSWKNSTRYFDMYFGQSTQGYRSNQEATDWTNCQQSTNDDSTCVSYVEFSVQSSSLIVYNKRTYKSLVDTFGVIGGTNGVLMLLIIIIYHPVNKKKRTFNLIQQVYPLLVSEPPKSQGRGIYCCKKKSNEMILWEKKYSTASQRIMESLDITNIVHDFNILKIISHVLMHERHFELAQIVGFGLWMKDCSDKSEREKLLQEEQKQIEKQSKKRVKLRHVNIAKLKSKMPLWIKQLNESQKLEIDQVVDGLFKQHLSNYEVKEVKKTKSEEQVRLESPLDQDKQDEDEPRIEEKMKGLYIPRKPKAQNTLGDEPAPLLNVDFTTLLTQAVGKLIEKKPESSMNIFAVENLFGEIKDADGETPAFDIKQILFEFTEPQRPPKSQTSIFPPQ